MRAQSAYAMYVTHVRAQDAKERVCYFKPMFHLPQTLKRLDDMS